MNDDKNSERHARMQRANCILLNKWALGGLNIGDLQRFLTVCSRKRPFVGGCEISLAGDPAYFNPVAFMRRKKARICLWSLESFGKIPDLADNEGSNAHWRECKDFRDPDLSVPADKIVKLQGDIVTLTVDDNFRYRGGLFSDYFENKEILIRMENSPF